MAIGLNQFRVLGVLLLLLGILLGACGESAPNPTVSKYLTPTSTVPPPFLAAPIQSPQGLTGVSYSTASLTPTLNPLLSTPIVAPTPVVPKETLISSDDLGINAWGDTEINWSPSGNHYLLHIINQNDPLNFYFLIRPPSSVVASYKLSRSVFGTFAWSPNNRYLSFIQQDKDGNAGPVKLIDTEGAAYSPIELFKGPCNGADWLNTNTILATCGSVVLSLSIDQKTSPEVIIKLDEQGHLPGSPLAMNLIARALPSPDGNTLAVFGLQTSVTGRTPVGEIGFLDLQSRKFSVLDRSDRAVAPIDWTPDSKYLILRNLTGDWTVSYTYDFYLADPDNLTITYNLTNSNPGCDPVLGKVACQGMQTSVFQTSRISFSPTGNRYFVTGLRYVPRPNVGIQTVERLLSGGLNEGKPEPMSQVVEHIPGGKIIGLTWLPNGHFFYCLVTESGNAKAFFDNKLITVAANKAESLLNPVTVSGAAVDYESNLVKVFGVKVSQADTITISTTLPLAANLTSSPVIQPVEVSPISSPTLDFEVQPTRSVVSPEAETNLTPAGTIVELTATPIPIPIPTNTQAPVATPTPKSSREKPLLYGYFISPTGRWVISLEKISGDLPVQFQLRLIPFRLP